MSINVIIGKNLSNLRKQAKLTQLELAEKFNYSDKSISKWEAGDSMPSIEILNQLAKFYNVTLDYLVTEEHIEQPAQQNEKIKVKKDYGSTLKFNNLEIIEMNKYE